jgi:Beta/Gamma crystallin/CVNH domain
MTRRLGFVGAVALTFGMYAGAGPAMAQPVPPGSYQSSCDNVSVIDDTLRARCETEDGNWMNSRLNDYSECDGDISNIDGRLSCTRADDDPGDGPDDDRGDRVPRGSYQQTCQNERVESGDLIADCADRNGRLRHSELANHRFCRGDIANDNGILSCLRNNDGDDDYTVPTGSWRATCRDHRVSRNVLFAECRDRFGRWVETSVDLRGCRQGVANVNGRLVCVVPAPLAWRISLYRNIGYTGTGRTFTGDVPNLARYGMANVASSAYLRSGAWQLCTRTYYRGQCVTLRASAPNFRRLGINDQARSLRRVR